MRLRRLLLLAAFLLPLSPAWSAEPALSVRGTTFQGQAFDLATLRGKVVLVMYWSTDCAVCRDKMQELRLNYEGWKSQPFELVLISTDRRMQDVEAYEKLIAQMVPARQQFVQLWSRAPGYSDNVGPTGRLPLSLLIDKQGRTVERYSGRIPPEAWDRIADLL